MDAFHLNSVNSLQSGAIVITQRGVHYEKGHFITKWVNRYSKVECTLLSGATLLQSRATITEKASTSLST